MGLFAALMGQAEKSLKEASTPEAKIRKPDKPQGEGLALLAKARQAPEATPHILYGRPDPGGHSRAAKPEAKLDFPGADLESLREEKETRRKLDGRSSRSPRAGQRSELAESDELASPKKALSKPRGERRDESQDIPGVKPADLAAAFAPRSEDRSKAQAAKDEPQDSRRIESDKAKVSSRDDQALASRVQVMDLRKSHAKKEASAPADAGEVAGAKKGEEPGRRAEMSLDLSKAPVLTAAERKSEAGSLDAAPKTNDFATVLAERLREGGNTEIVQSARIILKDGDAGTIRMRLNPPELGNVKIELNLADNSISGKIIVESDDAKSAFEKGLAELQDAFRSGGFESAKLEVSVGSGDAGQGGARDRGQEGAGPFWSERRRSVAFDPSAATMPAHVARADRAVDIIV